MNVRSAVTRLREALTRNTLERELDDELRLHRDLLIAEFERRGLSASEARRAAGMKLGGIDQGKEAVRDARGLPFAEAFLRDLAYAGRMLRKAPGFSIVTILTLALGIAVNVAIFSIVDGVVLRPLPYPDPDRLVSIWESRGDVRGSVAPANLADYCRSTSFDGIAGLAARTRNLTTTDQPEALQVEEVTDNYFTVLGVAPALGRNFTEADMRAESAKVAVISDALWRRRFAGDQGVLNRSIDLDSERYQIIGVMPPGFLGLVDLMSTDRRAVWTPAVYPPELLANRGDHEIRLVARLAPDASLEAARAEFTAISQALGAAYPDTNAEVRAEMQPLRDDIVRNVRTSLVVLLLMVGLILTIACVNVANLFLARGVGRRREIAVRFALGASRTRVVTSLVTESLMLAAMASVVGVVFAAWMHNALVAAAPANIPRLDGVAMDARVLAYTGLVAVVTGLLFGAIPAWQAGHSTAADALAGAGRVVAGAAVMRWRNALMLAQVALSCILLVGAGLMVTSLVRLNSVPLGFDAARVLAMRIALPEKRYPTATARLQFFEELERRVLTIPGVEVAGFANNLPLRGGWGGGFGIDGVATPPKGFEADFQAVSAGYFRTLGITLADGRSISSDDRVNTQGVAVVSRLFERRFLAGQSALGRQIRRGPDAPLITIVGVVDDVRRDGRASELQPQIFLPAAQTTLYPVRLADLAVRARGNPTDLMPAIRAAVWSLDSEQPISNVRTLDDLLLAGSASRRFQALLFSLFAVLALVLASVGTYGVVSYVVSQRTPEIGVRLALGADAWDIRRWLLSRTMIIVAAGAFIGLVAARWLGQFVSTLLFAVSVGDPASYVLAGTAVSAVALAANLLAARRATSIDPTQALRDQ
jgi:putative ABC transport system permease protein